MTPPDVKKAFDPFVRLPSSEASNKPGFGIGLSLVKHLVELLQGSMEVRSTPGIGSAFVVRLPTRIARDATPAPGTASFLEIRPGAATVMVVDDVPEVLNALLETVRRQGAVGLAASNAAEALALTSVHAIDLALIDYQMPVRNGLSLAAELARRHPQMHLVLISAFPEPEIFSEASLSAIGAHGFAEKPLKGATIRRLIDAALIRKNTHT
jgi:CheY-like chemotaxis protein